MNVTPSHSSPSTTVMSRPDNARYSCPSCSKLFVRKAHMLRHQQQHATQKPFICSFCSKSFKRSDVLRAHQFRCKERGDAPVPEGQSKGRKRSSCASCVKLRTRCDQETPCSRCVELGKECVRAPNSHQDAPRRIDLPRPKSRDAIPIAHLLNSPPDDDFAGRFPVPETEEDGNTAADGENESEASHWSEEMEPYDPYTVAVDSNTAFDSFFDGLGEPLAHLFWSSPLRPFGQHQIPETLSFNTSVMRSEVMPGFQPMPLGMTDLRLAAYEARAHEVREILQLTASNFGPSLPDSQAMLGLGPNISMLTATEMASLIDLFFQHYHKHCPILHKPSFDLTVVPMALLMAVLALGGMYAPDKARVERMRSLLDVIELYVFNLPGLKEEYPYTVDLSQAPDDNSSHAQFQMLQGGYLVIVAQYFSGNLSAKRRARRQRFMRVLDIARSFRLPLAQHPHFITINDERSWQTWIRQENRIRFFNIMIAFDAAMAIFNNVPPRITFSELDLVLPCEQRFWEMGSYGELASQPLFPQPRPKLMDLFQLLFVPAPDFQSAADKIAWNCWDMLFLVHLLYCHVWRQTFSNPLLRRSPYTLAPTNILEPLKTAIRNWKALWDDVRSRLTPDELRGMGFETSADSYWTLTKLILQAFDVNHPSSGTNYAASNSESASVSSPAADQTTVAAATRTNSGHHRQTSQGSHPDANGLTQLATTNGNSAYGTYQQYTPGQGGIQPIAAQTGLLNGSAVNAGFNVGPSQQQRYPQMMQQRPNTTAITPQLKQEDEIVNASGLPPGLGLSGNYTLTRGSANIGTEPNSATATEFGAGLDFMPLEADCDTQGAHLKKILKGANRP